MEDPRQPIAASGFVQDDPEQDGSLDDRPVGHTVIRKIDTIKILKRLMRRTRGDVLNGCSAVASQPGSACFYK